MGQVHLEAVRRLGFVDVAAVAGSSLEKARELADDFGVEGATDDYRALLQNPAIHAVHICTPNAQHVPMASAALRAGKHVLCEKPLAMTSAQAAELVVLAESKNVRNCTCHNLRYYPLVQQMRRMRESGELGDILIVQGAYSQDWLFYDTDWNWRVDGKKAGALRAMGDIGSHWCDMAEHVTGLQITSLCADLTTFHKARRLPTESRETFSGGSPMVSDYVEVPVDTEDFGAVIFHLGERARGAFTVSQVSAGCKNRLSIEIYGTKSGVAWDQERPDELWIGNRNTNNQVIIKDPALLKEGARSYADLPGGHSEGYDDTFKQVFRRFYASIENPDAEPEYPEFADGLRQLRILEAELGSHQRHGWMEVPQ